MVTLGEGLSRPYDREMGIAGGELIILDLETNEVIGSASRITSELAA